MTTRDHIQRADRDLPALTVLALLSLGPRHTYDMHRFMVATRKDFVVGLPRSLYHAVDKLEKSALIAEAGTEQAPGRPERMLYRITDAGRAELRRRISLLLATPEPDATLAYAALSFIGALGPDETLAALRARVAAIELKLARLAGDLGEAVGVPRILLLEAEFEQARLVAEREWMQRLVGDLESGALPWPDLAEVPPPPGW
ncbi:PadR family transcriptional regulator [Agromyces sp. Root81]|uniref:PadR family transcriptional regulator n=1 Tax=Agromyces sp. Root81 TaxID=1736601 RepID=UPI0006FE9E91|nr:helix-turn-helix transcriptional regulator [Agromyces sp. Root81]KRC61956.1 PadR family transcriptional regulator [Agromyces sp. Root81]